MKKPNGLFAALRKAITDPVTLAPQPAVPVADAPPLRATAPAPERSKEMILAGKVTQVISGSEYADGKQRIDIRVEDAESRLRLVNTIGLRLDDAVTLTVTVNNDAKYTQPLAAGMRESGHVE